MIDNERQGDLQLIAGPCSINSDNLNDISRLAEIRVRNLQGDFQQALSGVRMVGLKSRTGMDLSGKGMGIDFRVYRENERILEEGGTVHDLKIPPSVKLAGEIVKQTGMIIGSEMMDSRVQMPCYERMIPDGKMLAWSPAVQQLGWPISPMARVTKKHNWLLGIKNGKWLDGEMDLQEANKPNSRVSDIERTWIGLASYARAEGVKDENLILIQRGICVPGKGDYRSAPIHEIARRTRSTVNNEVRLWFDPSHSLGSKLRDRIVETTIEAMSMKDGNNWLYDGALIETGSSLTDAGQHITIDEMRDLAAELAKFRNLRVLRD